MLGVAAVLDLWHPADAMANAMAASSAARLIERLRVGPVCCVSICNEPLHNGARRCTLVSAAAAATAWSPRTAIPRALLPHCISSRTTVPCSPPEHFPVAGLKVPTKFSRGPRPGFSRGSCLRPSAPQSAPQGNTYRTRLGAEKLLGPVRSIAIRARAARARRSVTRRRRRIQNLGLAQFASLSVPGGHEEQ
jgi:hypothetical protein